VSCCEFQFFDTDDADIGFDDPRLSLELERSKWVSNLLYDFQGKDTEALEIENDYSSISNDPLFLQWMMNDPKLLSLDLDRSKSAPDLIDLK
jgi:hypothetical protein